jgi:hypothetical protein
MEYDTRHGGPYDRGGADSYYRRGFKPHYYTGDTMQSDQIPEALMTPDEIKAYTKGFDDNEDLGDFKDWG